MDLSALLHLVIRRGWLAVAGGAVGAALGLALALARPAAFEATTRLALVPARPADLGQTQATKAIMRTWMEDIRTYDMADAVAARLGEDWFRARGVGAGFTRYLLDSGQLGVAADENVYEVQITARSPDPATAVQLSEKWAETFADRRDKANLEIDREERIEALIRDEPVPHQYAPRRKLIVAAGALAGFGLGAALLLLAEYLESAVVRSAREAARASGALVLGTVPPAPSARSGSGALRRALGELAEAWPAARRWWPVALLALVGAASAFAFSQAVPTVHRARTRVALEPARGSDWGNTQALRETMRGYTQDILTRRMARDVDGRLALDLPVDALLEKVNVAEDVAVYEIDIDAFDADPAVAARISRAWADVFIEAHRVADGARDQRDRILARVRDATRTAPWSPQPVANTAAGAVLGALAGAAAVALLGLARAGLVTGPADASREAGAPLLGVIPPEGRGAAV